MDVMSATEVRFTTDVEQVVSDWHHTLLGRGYSYEGAVAHIEANGTTCSPTLRALAEPTFRAYLLTGSPEIAALVAAGPDGLAKLAKPIRKLVTRTAARRDKHDRD